MMDTGLPSSPVQQPSLSMAQTLHGRAGVVCEGPAPAIYSPLPNFKEYDLQVAVARYLDEVSALSRKFIWMHPPNEGARKIQYRVKLKLQGLKRGPADCLLFCAGGRTIHIELKRDAGLSPSQKEWRDMLSRLGHVSYLVKEKTPAAAVAKVEEILRKERLM
jgi:hypothetical protein